MKIWLRFILSFSLILAFMITIILVSLNQIKVSHEKLTRIVKTNNVRIQLANQMIDNARESAINTRNVLLAKYQRETIKEIQKRVDELTWCRKTYQVAAANLETLFPKEDTKGFEILRIVSIYADSVREYQDKVIGLVMANRVSDGADLMFGSAYPRVKIWIKEVGGLVNYNEEYNTIRYDQAAVAQTIARNTMIILGLLAIALSIAIAYFLTRSITNPLKIATSLVLTRDLTMDLSAYQNGGGELGLMIQSFSKEISKQLQQEKELIIYRDQLEDMVKQRTAELSKVLEEVKETINILAASSTEILAATTQVATGTAETATAIAETSATVEEVQQASKLSSQKAKNVADSAQRVVQTFQTGQKAVEDTISGMNKIREQMDSIALTIVRLSEQSQSIGGIIASVTDIADQSNLLAVNAAIEAAKAGEQGKGFAVVAQEIKNLAGQSKQATLQVRNILNDIQKVTGAAVMATEQGSKAVEAGLKQSLQAGEAIRILAESSNEAVLAATQIVASSQQQVVGMDQIGVAMHNINQAGTETAVSMFQAEKSAKSLYELGQKLKVLIEKFKG